MQLSTPRRWGPRSEQMSRKPPVTTQCPLRTKVRRSVSREKTKMSTVNCYIQKRKSKWNKRMTSLASDVMALKSTEKDFPAEGAMGPVI